jgi:hypothetical protein
MHEKMKRERDPRWWRGEGIRISELCDFKNHLLHLGNSDSFLAN